MAEQDYPEPTQGGIETTPPEQQSTATTPPTPERAQLVKKILKRIKDHEKKYEKRFKQMRSDMALTRRGATKDWDVDTKYTANLIQRHVKQRVSSLYAKNPTVKANRRRTMDYMIWDGNMESAQAAMTLVGGLLEGQPLMPGMEQQAAEAQALVQDIAQGREKEKQIEGIGRALEICYEYFMDEGHPTFKIRAKQLVRRTVTCGVGYVKLGYQRAMGRTPDWNAKMDDASTRLAHLQRLSDEAAEGKTVFDTSAEIEELRIMVESMSQEPEVVLREGLIFDFPRSYDIIPIGDCVELKGFVGCEAVAQKMLFTKEKIREIYGKDLGREFTSYTRTGQQAQAENNEDWVCAYEYYDEASGMMYTVADGYCDFLEEPAPPPATVEQFFPFFVLSFNDIEDEGDIFPPSDPELLKSQQMEYNRSREALRQHRIANQPNYAAAAGAFPDWSDEQKIMSAIPHEILKLNALAPGQKIDDVLQAIKKVPVDGALYDTQFVFDDILRTVGAQEANLGGTSGSTATEASIGENSRQTAQSSEIDDMDDMLSQLARAGGQILLKELSPETVKKIAGQGAQWPSLSATEIAEELYLDIEMGSSGKPNKAMELANWERLLPILIQIPGISPNWVAKESIKRMDDHADMAEAVLDGAPSIMAMNAMQKAASNNPEEQGVHGGDNAEQAPGSPGGGQPSYGPDQAASEGAMSQVGGPPPPQGAPMPQDGPQDAGGGMPQQPQGIVDAQGMPMQSQPQEPQIDYAAEIQAVTQQAAQELQSVAQQSAQSVQEQAGQITQAVQSAGQEAVSAIQKAAQDAVMAIQQATQSAVGQVTNNATAQGMQAMIERMSQPQQTVPMQPQTSAIEQMLAEQLRGIQQ